MATGTDYQTVTRVKAPADAVFDAITTTTALTAWWARATGVGDSGGELKFLMNSPDPLVIRVDNATRPTLVEWMVTDCPFLTDWVGTRPTFTITPIKGDESELHFQHVGLTSQLECMDMCSRSWDHFICSLRDYVETGVGSPMGSEADNARREAEAAQ